MLSQEQTKFGIHRELGGIELLSARYGKKSFAKHYHETYTVSVIETGGQTFFRSGAEHFAPQHSIILVNADDIHTGQAADGVGWSYRAIYPYLHQFQSLAQQLGWGENYRPYFNEPVVYDPELAYALRRLFYQLECEPSQLAKEQALHYVLSELMIRHSKSVKHKTVQCGDNQKLSRAKSYLIEHTKETISLTELANFVDLSPYYLTRLFKKEVGLPPHQFHIQQKINHAKTILKQGETVLETAMSLGFHDQSHFHRHFKNSMGVTPGQYAKAIKNS